MNISVKKTPISLSLAVMVVASLALPAPAHAGPALAPVGPRPLVSDEWDKSGFLRVYSRTEQTEWGDNSYYYIHTAYWIYDLNSRCIRTVNNHDTCVDEKPQKIALAPGTYTVRAWSDNDGLVTVRVIIKRAEETSVRLESK
jgi:hypothetical protein